MKLIDLLKIELPKRGGWPEGATIAWQSEIDGEIYFCGDEGSRVKYSKLRLGWSSDLGYDAGVTREQYEAAQQPAWDGEGLPPVGVECERDVPHGWAKCKINYSSKKHIVYTFIETGEEYSSFASSFKFRPIRAEADHKREETITSLLSLGVFTRPVAEKTIDAIAAGKITGVELV